MYMRNNRVLSYDALENTLNVKNDEARNKYKVYPIKLTNKGVDKRKRNPYVNGGTKFT